MEDKDAPALVSREGTFEPIIVVEGHAFMQLHINKPSGPGMTLVLWIRESFIQDTVFNWLTIGKAQIDDLFIWNIKGDISEGDSGDIQSLLRYRYNVIFEGHGCPSNNILNGNPWFQFYLLDIVPPSIVVNGKAVFNWYLKNIK